MKQAALLIFMTLTMAAQSTRDEPRFNGEGEVMLPPAYREWIFLSSGLGMTYGPAARADGGNPMFENVFVNPSSYRTFLETGRWPEKTMFILEIRRAEEKGSINKGGHYQSGIVAIEAEVKDESRFPQKWAYFNFGRGDKAAPLPANSNCNTCHGSSAAVEHTFVQFYPSLIDVAKQKGTLNPEYLKSSGAPSPH
jgi:hypothetical protein